jgi:hypothetical protein
MYFSEHRHCAWSAPISAKKKLLHAERDRKYMRLAKIRSIVNCPEYKRDASK